MSPAIEPPYVENMDRNLDKLRNLKPSSDASDLHGVTMKDEDIIDKPGTGYNEPGPPLEVMSIASSQKDAPKNPWNTWNSGAKDKGGNANYD